MKKILCFAFVLFLFSVLFSNPITPSLKISEIQFVEDGWQINIISEALEEPMNLSSSYIYCNEDSAFFNNDIVMLGNDAKIITQDDLQSSININPNGDNIGISSDFAEGNHCNFGTLDDMVLVPGENQSLSMVGMSYNAMETTHYSFAKDNIPFEYIQNFPDLKGTFNGYVYDEEMNPVFGVILDKNPDCISLPDIITDENGWFEAELWGFNYNLNIHLATVVSIDTTLAIEPQQVNRYDFILEGYSGSEEEEIHKPLYSISNSPNPFNPVTTISFGRVLEQRAKVKIYNSKGGLVDELNCTAGRESISWDAGTTASGVYFYKLEVENSEVSSGKMLLLK